MPNTLTVRGGIGDMLKSIYDTDGSGKVDDSQKLQESTKIQVQDHTPKSHTHTEAHITDLAHIPNPHTHTEAQISDLDHNAQKLKGVIIDDSAKADQKVLAYDQASQNIVYITPSGGAAINSIQQGLISVPLGELTATLTINSVDTSKSIIAFAGTLTSGWKEAWIYVELTNSTTVTATSKWSGYYGNVRFTVVEFASGFKPIQRGVLHMLDNDLYKQHTITAVDLAKAFLNYCGFTSSFTSDTSRASAFCHAHLLNSTTVRADRQSGANQAWLSYEILEFE